MTCSIIAIIGELMITLNDLVDYFIGSERINMSAINTEWSS